MNHFCSSGAFFFVFIILVTICLTIEAQTCNPSGKIVGKKPPPKQCNPENQSECCKKASSTPLKSAHLRCPSVHAKSTLTISSFEKGGDGGGPSECDNKFHSDNTTVVALSTGWFNNRKRCSHYITMHANGRSTVKAKVVDECDSTMGCDLVHDSQPPCPHNIVDASPAVWKALGVKESDWVKCIYSGLMPDCVIASIL